MSVKHDSPLKLTQCDNNCHLLCTIQFKFNLNLNLNFSILFFLFLLLHNSQFTIHKHNYERWLSKFLSPSLSLLETSEIYYHNFLTLVNRNLNMFINLTWKPTLLIKLVSSCSHLVVCLNLTTSPTWKRFAFIYLIKDGLFF